MSKDLFKTGDWRNNRILSYGWLREVTLCRRGRHCAPRRRIQKFDGGKLPQLCCYCRLIVAWGPKPDRAFREMVALSEELGLYDEGTEERGEV